MSQFGKYITDLYGILPLNGGLAVTFVVACGEIVEFTVAVEA